MPTLNLTKHEASRPSPSAPDAPIRNTPARIASVDIFRGLTMVVMVFVNQLAEIRNLPWWTYHMPDSSNGMTYVDMVYPFFLFLVGISIPLAVRSRIAKGATTLQIWIHVAARSFALIVLGIVLANGPQVNRMFTGIGQRTWMLLALTAAVLLWNSYPRPSSHAVLFRAMRFAGLALLVAMLAMFRRQLPNGQSGWLDFSYWEILGMIGWTYLAVAALYLLTMRWKWAPIGWFIALTVLNIASAAHWISFTYRLPFYVWPLKTGAGASIVMAGIATSFVLFMDTFTTRLRTRIGVLLCSSAALAGAGWLLAPLGISKAHATPSWCLFCASAAAVICLLLYLVADIEKKTAWATFAKPAGANTLLTYLLPYFFAALFGREVLAAQWQSRWPGALQAVAFTAVILAVSAVLTRCRVRVQL